MEAEYFYYTGKRFFVSISKLDDGSFSIWASLISDPKGRQYFCPDRYITLILKDLEKGVDVDEAVLNYFPYSWGIM